ncbi:hypothetical protein NIE88_09055 [Sporolactobacillus shoreicorticis]|uniref:YdhG-like domain-containing protein n=1 Tax=Sporolactobacillus shoreicorticis TaxID=1923877 RepID=A0ABW5S229_9BACL|nr:hypothetical protein [Sporolactobacillus shoreicorticis]MCO7125920.1 hypothetical protein [Sporolactobacillus shoreicorticis]
METVTDFLGKLEYLDRFNNRQKLWLHAMVSFMRGAFPNWDETTFCRMPAYRWHQKYIAFSATKDYFSFYTNDMAQILYLKKQLVSALFGKRCVRVSLDRTEELPAFFEACRGVAHWERQDNLHAVRAKTVNRSNNDSIAKRLLQ